MVIFHKISWKNFLSTGNHPIEVKLDEESTTLIIGAAGAIESIATIISINESIIPPTINYKNPDPNCDLNYTPNTSINKTINYAMSNTFGFGGHNASLIFKKYEK